MKQRDFLWIGGVAVLLLLLLWGVMKLAGSQQAVPTGTAEGAQVIFTPEEHFFEGSVTVNAVCQYAKTDKYTLFYTFGANPAVHGKQLKKEGFTLKPRQGEDVSCYTVRMVAKFPDGTCSEEAVHSYFVGENIQERFDISVFSLTVDPEDYQGEKGIYTNYDEQGKEWEKPVHVEYFSPAGEQLLAQDAGIRIHGGYSRTKAMKSYRLYARADYDENRNSFNYPFFPDAADAQGEPITEYKRLVLRSSGNDMNHTFVRDALAQTLASEAGFPDTEKVLPTALFINGTYQGFYWAQDFISGKYFKTVYGKHEGTLKESDHKENAVDTREENLEFPELASLDLTAEENYKQVTDTIDVENYLFYYAVNTILDNEDWPQTNSLSYRYSPAPGEEYGSGVLDGRWRFILHDSDMILGLGSNHPYRECLKAVLDPDAVKHHSKTLDLFPYSPLFAALMEREDCRQYYVNKVKELTDGIFSPAHMNEVLDSLTAMQKNELSHYYKECAYADGKTMADYAGELAKLRQAIDGSRDSIRQQIFDLWGMDIR